MRNLSQGKRLAIGVAKYVGIIVGTLVVFDLLTIALGLFPPTYDYGDPDAGWVAARPTGRMQDVGCTEYSTGQRMHFARNEDGVRTSFSAGRLRNDGELVKIGVSGDSQTELCVPNAQAHFGVLERELTATGMKAAVFAFGTGRYSPLQAYLSIKPVLRRYAANAFVLNFYTGNDFHDMLRVDDRPHMVPLGGEYVIAKPVWYQRDDPTLRRRSRVLFALRSVAKKTRISQLWVRIRFLSAIAAEQGEGVSAVMAYMNDVRKSIASDVGYSAAFSAQMLNQQLFFHRFPGSREESIRRVRALLELVRRENPGMLLVMSPLPSYELVQQQPVDEALLRVLRRLPVTYEESVREEGELYEKLRQLAAEAGWLFVDNLKPLRDYAGGERLYNGFDYHFLPVASEIIGEAQAATIATHLRTAVPTPH